ncbi:MAG TPA: DNA recombination protein RmuC [Thermoanaerobaculia bacterium]|nr:DNA recombination protein RmuC [Thermoanaerobaculia bacterium]
MVLTAALVLLVVIAAGALFLYERRTAQQQRDASDQRQILLSLATEAAASKALAESSGRGVLALSEALENRLGSFERTIDERIKASQAALGQNIGTMQQQSAESAMLLKSVGENLGKVFEASKKIEKLAGDVTRLEDLLKPPKIRGLLGEAFLEEALRQVLPPGSWEMQKRFADGEVVDAAVRLGERFVPIDSKFPYESYRRALDCGDDSERKRLIRQLRAATRKQADDIARKYIRSAEGTFEFALMYLPAEALYAEIVAEGDDENVAEYAIGRHVIPVSPTLLYAYLFTVAQGLRGLEIEKRAHVVVEELALLKRGIDKIEEPFGKLGNHLSNAQKQYEETFKQLARFAERLREIADSEDSPAQAALPLRVLPPES